MISWNPYLENLTRNCMIGSYISCWLPVLFKIFLVLLAHQGICLTFYLRFFA